MAPRGNTLNSARESVEGGEEKKSEGEREIGDLKRAAERLPTLGRLWVQMATACHSPSDPAKGERHRDTSVTKVPSNNLNLQTPCSVVPALQWYEVVRSSLQQLVCRNCEVRAFRGVV